jgi:hypothetical protein
MPELHCSFRGGENILQVEEDLVAPLEGFPFYLYTALLKTTLPGCRERWKWSIHRRVEQLGRGICKERVPILDRILENWGRGKGMI